MDKNIIIRQAIITDCYALSVLKREVWRTTYQGIYSKEKLEGYDVDKNKGIFENIISNPDIELYVAECNKELVGLMTVGKPFKLFDQYEQEVGLLYIRKDYQRNGLGKEFLNIAKRDVLSKGYSHFVISVNEKNDNAIEFYLAMGGSIVFEGNGQKRFLFTGGKNDICDDSLYNHEPNT